MIAAIYARKSTEGAITEGEDRRAPGVRVYADHRASYYALGVTPEDALLAFEN